MNQYTRLLAESVSDKVTSKCFEEDVDDLHRRRLAGGGDIELDYTIFNVAIMTLALLLLVEHFRHHIDHRAAKHKFVKRVLEVLYEELSTLGIVESIIFILVKYNQNERFISVELAFAEVHFMLFYTTIFNAMMSCLVAYGSKRISKNLWVKSEVMDMDHYVAIRREFNNLDKQINTPDSYNMAEGFMKLNLETFGNISRNILQFLKHPHKSRIRNSMLVVIRFHEIRAHFLKENNLPSQFKVSDYLKKCEREVFQKLAHIPTSLWLILIGILNFIYLSMGLVASTGEKFHQQENNHRIGIVLSWLFIGMCIALAILSFAMLQRIKWIFSKIIHKDFLNQEVNSTQGFGSHATQLDLFFFQHPSLFITFLRYMQFAYALGAGTLLVFWDSVGISQKHLELANHDYFEHSSIQLRWSLFFCLVLSFLIFFVNAKNLIPRFTLCTNLGQLVNQNKLSETLSLFHLEQEKWKRKLNTNLKAHSRTLSKRKKKEIDRDKSSDKPQKVAGAKENNRLSHLEQISHFVHVPTDSLPAPPSLDPGKRRARRDRRNRRSLSDSAAFFAPFPASTQSFRNNIEDTSLKKTISKDVNLKSKTTEDIPTKGKKKRRERSASAPLRGGISTLFAIDEQKPRGDEKEKPLSRRGSLKSIKSVLSTLHEEVTSSPEKKDVDSVSIATSISIYEGSDTEDIPEAALTSKSILEKKTPSTSFSEKVRYIYQTRLYNTIDTVVGTFFCLYLVGMRLEILLVDSCKIKQSTNSVEFSISTAFWLEFSLLVYFIISSIVFILIHIPDGVSIGRFEIIAAESLDVFLCGSCLSLLLTSEFIRCLLEDGTCPLFGTRPGVGTIEPFTAFIVLRPFRHHLGRFITKCLRQCLNLTKNRYEPENGTNSRHRDSWLFRSNSAENPLFFHSNLTNDHVENEPKEAIILSWTKIVEKNPELVHKYGMFSSEILQAMLGLNITEQSKKSTHNKSAVKNMSNEKKIPQIHPKSKRWSRLSIRAQSVIISGEVGQPTNMTTLPRSSSWISNYGSDDDEQSKLSDLASFDGNIGNNVNDDMCYSNGINPTGFDETAFVSNYQLKAPHAVLIRSMRRCERKMLPLFSSWEQVDVVMTQHEMVFFAVNEYDLSNRDEEEDTDGKMKAVREAMKARYGGKGLLLSDVIAGRKIVGHTDISQITSIKVRQPTEVSSNVTNVDKNKDHNPLKEYWTDLEDSSTLLPLQDRFTKSYVKLLKLHDGCGQTILLRFLCDLDLAENTGVEYRKKRVDKEDLKNTMPLLWCHTLARVIGPDHLDQKMPHFGNDDDDELNDYMEEYSRDSNFSGRMRLLATSIIGKSTSHIEMSSMAEVEPNLL